MSFAGGRGIIQTTSRKKEVPSMMYALLCIVILGGAMALNR